MKKILAVVLSLIVAFAAVGCANSKAAYVPENASVKFEAFDYNKELSDFVGKDENGEDKNKDRTAFSDGGKAAGDYIVSRLSACGYEPEKQDYSISVATTSGSASVSAVNVIATYNAGKEKRVAILAHYDNMFGKIEASGVTGNGSSGIADNATGVVTLISIAEAFAANAPELDFTVDFVFTGSDEYAFSGTAKYLSEWKRSTEDILLAVNLETIVGNKINVYSDVVNTVQQGVFVSGGESYDTTFSGLSKTAPVLPIGLTGTSEYSDYGQLSGAAEFISRNIPVVSLFGWNTDEFGYFVPEYDNYADFTTNHAEFASVAKDTASLVFGAITDSRFAAASEKFTSGEGYGFFNGGYFAYLAYLGLIIVLCVALIVVVKKLAKKHGSDNIGGGQPRGTVKIAVFGPEYEDTGEGDVIVDIRDEKEDKNDPFADDNN